MVDRVIRVRCAIRLNPSASEGRKAWRTAPQKSCAGSTKPDDGSHPSPRANSRIIMIPQKKSGRLTPISATEELVVSCQRLRCTAAHTPRGTASTSAMVMDIATISAEAAIFSASSSAIGFLKISDVPQSPVSIPPIQRPYCTISGSFRPSDWRSPSSASGFDCVPMIIIATSPGRMLVTPKVTSEIRNSVRITDKSRLST